MSINTAALTRVRDDNLAADNDDTIGVVESYLTGGVVPVVADEWRATVTIGRSAKYRRWDARRDTTLAEIAADVRAPLVRGEKDGSCYIPATLAGSERKAAAVTEVSMLVYDVDGSTSEDIDAALSSAGVLAVAHTTHSHKSTVTHVASNHVAAWATREGKVYPLSIEDMRAYLAATNKAYLRDVTYDPSPDAVAHTDKGLMCVIKHAPVDKWRVMIPLAEPIVLQTLGTTTKDVIAEYKAIYHGVATTLGLAHDRACEDPSRLYYDPSHKPGGEYLHRVYGDVSQPMMLDWREETRWTREHEPEGKGKGKGASKSPSKSSSPSSSSPRKEASSSSSGVRRVPRDLDIESLLRAKLPPEMIGPDRERGGFVVACPHESNHASPGMGGCFAANASAEHPSWSLYCSHNSCSANDKHDRLAEYARAGYLDDADLGCSAESNGRDDKLVLINWRTNGASHSETVREVMEHVVACNAHDPKLFELAGDVVRVRADALLGETVTERLTQSGLRAVISDRVDFQLVAEESTKHIACPKDVAEHAYSLVDKGFPPLAGIATAPFFDRDGGLVVEPGYHEASGYYYAPPPGFAVPPVPDAPSDDDVRQAVANLDDVLCDFPFFDGDDANGEASRATVYAKLLQPFVREMIDGPCPLYVTQKPLARTGASLLTDVCSLICFGTETNAMTEKADDAEYDKVLATMIREGARHIVFDNLSRKLDSAPVAQFVTSSVYRSRSLGTNTSIAGRVTQVVEVAGNNVQLSDELRERSLLTTLNARVERPQERGDFRHDPLKPYVKQRRGELVWSLLVLVRRWQALGRPPYKGGKRLGAFETYVSTIGGILEAADIPGFMENRHRLAESTGDEGGTLKDFVALWWRQFGEALVPVGSLENHAVAPAGDLHDGDGDVGITTLCGLLLANADAIDLGFNHLRKSGWQKGMGKVLTAAADRVFDLEGGVRVALCHGKRRVAGGTTRLPSLKVVS